LSKRAAVAGVKMDEVMVAIDSCGGSGEAGPSPLAQDDNSKYKLTLCHPERSEGPASCLARWILR
jgi:hypothetical protein